MEKSKSEKNILMILLFIVLFLTIAILYPFLTIIVISVAFAVILNPVFEWFKRKVTRNRPGWASLLTIILFIIVLGIPLFFIGSVIFEQTQNAYQFISQSNPSEFIERIDNSINRILPSGFEFNTYEKLNNLATFISSNLGLLFTTTLSTVLMTLLAIYAMFYMLKNGEEWKKGLIRIVPLSESTMIDIVNNLKDSINRVLGGAFIIAIIQGILVSIGLWIFGVPNPALWGVFAGFASFIPTIGTSIISIPAILYLFFTGLPLHALGLLIWSVVLVGTIDNLLQPYIISRNSDISPIFILFSILGGISIMGPVGILIGPLIVSLLYSLVAIYRKNY